MRDFELGQVVACWFQWWNLFYHTNNISAIDVKMDRSVVGLLLGMLGLTLSSKSDWGSYIVSIVEAKKK